MQKLVSGFLSTDVMNFVDCPECSQDAGRCSVTHKNKKLSTPRKMRIATYFETFPDRSELYVDRPIAWAAF
jgi:hypothetical protein